MSKQHWAAIVYGRSYHLDFRFITIPHDFTAKEIAWASPYILATTQQARNLANYPRWSLFKNDTYCVIGVTCMVRDLLNKFKTDLVEIMTKDNLGRPLYVFVGYVTQLQSGDRPLAELPAYEGKQLDLFQPLYREIERVWLAKEYEDRQPWLSQYQLLDPTTEILPTIDNVHHLAQLGINSQLKHPHQTFLWSRSTEQNRQLWLASAQCLAATSICLDIQGKPLFNSPFLNQTTTKIQQFTIQERILTPQQSNPIPQETSENLPGVSLKQKISDRAKADLDLTWQQAAKVTSASQEMISNFNPWLEKSSGQTREQSPTSLNSDRPSLQPTATTQPNEEESFGFKAKHQSSSSQQLNEAIANESGFSPRVASQQDWF